MQDRPILVLGSTGYVGGRLVPLLLEKGFTVRAASRSVDKVRARPWGKHPGVQPVAVDMHDPDSLVRACDGCFAAFYLVHSMAGPARDFAEMERDAAYNMVSAVNATGVERVIYLGGLGEDRDDVPLSKHLRSRAEVGRILGLGSAQVTMLRAAQILGSGSASFELIRYLADRLPIMITPKWLNTRAQPIAIRNVLGYLVGCLENPETAGRSFDIGGPDVVTYRELFHMYGEEAGLRRRILLPVPFVSPRLSSHWVGLVTPIPVHLARSLIEGLRNEVVCQEDAIRDLVPQELVSCRGAIRRALQKIERHAVDTTCFDVGGACLPEWAGAGDPGYAGGTVYEFGYKARLQGDPEKVWKVVETIGGRQGWYYGDILWRLRGFIDKLLAGPGLRRGRPQHEDSVHVGDALDFWRILAVTPGERLLLLAEMRLPGEALLEFELDSHWENAVEVRMTARFLPHGLWGLAYWWAMYPFHCLLFRNMLKNISEAAGTHIYSPPERIGKS
ncbi:SDR family oxidoreductase [Pseudodesulfovibrio tunisiensis]|uniref:SDR family oxidoreductase n=1 Tax=Pseudodesulfovibrio tunisiensis TaxID=463192 RepID=UPI001FB4DEE0|nr:SDR family oxidoreductase [Pseudodesulfovibrio tunisiensis]